MLPYDQNNLSINFGSINIGTYHIYSSNEPNYIHYPREYSFESSDVHSRSLGSSIFHLNFYMKFVIYKTLDQAIE